MIGFSAVGVDLAWGSPRGREEDLNPSGLAYLQFDGKKAELLDYAYKTTDEEIIAWTERYCRHFGIVAVDAPLIAPNDPGTTRPGDRELTRDFGTFDAGVYPADREKCRRSTEFTLKMTEYGYDPNPAITPRELTKSVVEVYPHAAMVSLFGLKKILKYKKGAVEDRKKGLAELQSHLLSDLEEVEPALVRSRNLVALCLKSPADLAGAQLKALEDVLDSVVCAYTGLYYWYWGTKKCKVYGDDWRKGYIVTPAVAKGAIAAKRPAKETRK